MTKNSSRRIYQCRHSTAFTLVEILMAEAIFLILLVIAVQVVFSLIQTAASQKKKMDMLGDARQSLDRLSLDWSSRVRRSDTPGSFSRVVYPGCATNAQINFLSQVQAYSGGRHLAWVSYGVTNVTQVVQGSQTNATPALVRGIAGYDWATSTNATMIFPVSSGANLTTPASATQPPEPLANTVFRFDYCFMQQVPATVGVNGATTSSAFTVNPALNINSTNLVGVVAAVATIDQQSRQILSPAQLVALGNALPAITDGQSPQAAWLATINSGAFATQAAAAKIPASVANSVRVYQRILYIKE